MPLSSMTGFARREGDHEKFHWAWEIRSVNARNLDVRARTPNGFDQLEAEVRKRLAARFKRGSLQVSLHIKRHAEAAEVVVNEAALDQVLKAMALVKSKIDAEPPTLDGVLSLRGVLEIVEAVESEEERAGQVAALLTGFDETVLALAEARDSEGAAMEAVLVGQIDQIAALTADATAIAQKTPEKLRTRLMDQLGELLKGGSGLPEERLIQEIALLVSKADIREELDRLRAHCEGAKELIGADEPVGRKLDFLTQEFNRESNTLCSKASDVTLTRIGLELKSVVEQMREQVQNIE